MRIVPSTPFITIILPTKNSSGTIEAALKSIYDQTFHDFQILIMDGLSVDNTLEIAGNYQREFGRMKIISEKDAGIYDAMNKGIGLAEGKWLYFLGSDDLLFEKSTLEEVVKEMDENLDIIYGNVYSIRIKGVYDKEFDYLKLTRQNICHQAIFFRKRMFGKIGYFNLKYKSHADWDHNIRWFFSSKISHKYIDQVIGVYADGGFSSRNYDLVFARDRKSLILRKGIGHMSAREFYLFIKRMVDQEKRSGRKRKIVYPLIFIFGFIGRFNKFQS